MKIVVSGSTGLIGSALTSALTRRGDKVVPFVPRRVAAGAPARQRNVVGGGRGRRRAPGGRAAGGAGPGWMALGAASRAVARGAGRVTCGGGRSGARRVPSAPVQDPPRGPAPPAQRADEPT